MTTAEPSEVLCALKYGKKPRSLIVQYDPGITDINSLAIHHDRFRSQSRVPLLIVVAMHRPELAP